MTDKSGSPPCGIYLRIDDFSNMLDVIGHIRKMAFAINRGSGYEKNMSVVELVLDGENTEKVTDLVQIVKDQGLVCIIGGKTGKLELLNADGLIVKNADQIDKARTALGEDAIIGAKAGGKKEAEKIINTPLDLVLLPADPNLITWWSANSEILSVADGNGITPNNCNPLASAGASFVNASHYLLNHPKDVTQATINILDILEKAAKSKRSLN